MKRSLTRHFAHRTLAAFAIGALTMSLVVIIAQASTPTPFAMVNEPIGVAATTERVLVTAPYYGNPRQVLQIDPSGNVSVFATLPDVTDPFSEDYIAISPGLGGFHRGYVYVSQGPRILQITPDGSIVTLFATLPVDAQGGHVDLTFDTVGTFGFDMVVTGHGKVFRVTPTGAITPVGDGVDMMIEGPDVAPLSFGPLGGYLFVASNAGMVLAISPAGVITEVTTWPEAERVHFIPDHVYTLGSTGGAFFAASFDPSEILMYPGTDFVGLGGNAIVTSESGDGIGLITYNGSGYVTSTFCMATVEHEGSDFVQPAGNFEVPIDIKPTSCPNPLNMGSNGVVSVAILGTEDFDVTQVDPTTVRLEGGAPTRWAWADVATPFYPFTGRTGCLDCTTAGPDGYGDLTLRFDKNALVEALGEVSDGQCRVVHLTATLYDGTPITGEDVMRIQF